MHVSRLFRSEVGLSTLRIARPLYAVAAMAGRMRRSLQPYEFCVPAAADQVRTARRQVLSVLGPGHPCADSVSTVVSELVTNAVIHGSGAGDRVRVKVRLLRGSRVMVAVTDSGGGSGSGPRLRFGGAAETNGRGLFIVSALAEQWTVQSAGAGHRVRVVLAPGTDEGFCEGTKMVGDLATFPEFADLLSDVDGV